MIYSGFRVEIFMNESKHSGETFYGESVGSISFSYSILVFTIHVVVFVVVVFFRVFFLSIQIIIVIQASKSYKDYLTILTIAHSYCGQNVTKNGQFSFIRVTDEDSVSVSENAQYGPPSFF